VPGAPAGGKLLTDFHFAKIREFVFERSRLHFGNRKSGVLRQRLETRLEQLGLADLREYWGHLQENPAEEGALFDLVTTNETSFFRNSAQFDYLREVVLPGLESARGQDALRFLGDRGPGLSRRMKLRILCAGCSTGEEPYSVAMTVLEALRYPKAWDIEIVAGDLSRSCLETARAGYYETERLKGIPPELLDRYLTREAGGARVREELRRLVRFCPLNLNHLMNGATPAGFPDRGFDIVFCRNVMIYFSPSCQQLLVETLYRLTAPSGYLLTGDAEPLHLFNHNFSALRDVSCLIYQKTDRNTENCPCP
jgi:chemotaxis protein methyltransferase CheR